jgi:hypothetical protein
MATFNSPDIRHTYGNKYLCHKYMSKHHLYHKYLIKNRHHFAISIRGDQDMQTSRTSFPEAVKTVLEVLKKERSLSINALSRETGLNRRTVEKALRLLLEIQPYFQEIKLNPVQADWRKFGAVSERTGLLELPENVQRLIIRTMYYPNPSEEEILLIHLFLSEAFSPEKSLALRKDQAVQKLVDQGQLVEENRKVYLSDEGKIVAQGTLKIYPELLQLSKNTSNCSE